MSSVQAPVAPSEIGGLPPPAGIIPNFTDPYSISKVILAANIMFLTMTTVTTSIRCYTKLFVMRKLGWDDCQLKYINLLGILADQEIDTMFMAWVFESNLWNIVDPICLLTSELGRQHS